MPTTIPAGYGRLSWILGGFGLPEGGAVTLGLDLRTAGSSGSTLAVDIFTQALVVFDSVCSDLITLVRMELKIGPGETGPTYTQESGAAGGGSGNPAPPNVSILVKEKVDGVSGRLWGRMFWPGFDKANVLTGGGLNDAVAYQAVFDAFQDELESLNVYPAVLTSLPEGPRAVTGFDVASRTATQRRRLRR